MAVFYPFAPGRALLVSDNGLMSTQPIQCNQWQFYSMAPLDNGHLVIVNAKPVFNGFALIPPLFELE